MVTGNFCKPPEHFILWGENTKRFLLKSCSEEVSSLLPSPLNLVGYTELSTEMRSRRKVTDNIHSQKKPRDSHKIYQFVSLGDQVNSCYVKTRNVPVQRRSLFVFLQTQAPECACEVWRKVCRSLPFRKTCQWLCHYYSRGQVHL